MLLYFYIDYYILFVLIFLFTVSAFNVWCHFETKLEAKSNNYNKVSMVFFNFKVFFFVYFIYLTLLVIECNLNFIFQIKILFICFFFFLIMYENYAKLTKILNFEFLYLFMFCIVMLFLIMQCDNFLNFFVIIESYTLILCSVLISKKFTSKLVYSCFNYLILNLIASLFFLNSISFIYLSTGLINFVDINFFNIMNISVHFKFLYYFSLFLFLIGIFIKLTIFPFSFILLNIYKNMSSIYVYILLSIPKFIIIYFFIYFTNFFFFNVDIKFYSFFILLVLLTSLFHSGIIIKDVSFKEIIINISFINSPFLLAPVFFKSLFFIANYTNYIIIYFLNLFCYFFLMFIASYNRKKFVKKITSFLSLINLNFCFLILVLINVLSLSSLPPFSNFFTKLFIFYSLIENKLYYIYIFLSLLNLVIIYVFLRMIKYLFTKNLNIYLKYIKLNKDVMLYLICILSFLNMFYFINFTSVYIYLFNTIFWTIL